ncbi:hypothetical protein D3C86_2088420 [compost metagenome]
MIWKVATWVVTPGISVASRKAPMSSLLPLNLNRARIYAIIEPVRVAPAMEISTMMMVFMKPSSIFPSTKALV